MPFYTQVSLEFVRKTATFRTSSFNFHLFSQVFVNHRVQQNDILAKMSPFLEHLSVPKGCQRAWPSARPQRRAKALASVIRPFALVRRFASIDPTRRISCRRLLSSGRAEPCPSGLG